MDYLLEIIHVMSVIYVFDNVKRNMNILFGKKFRKTLKTFLTRILVFITTCHNM